MAEYSFDGLVSQPAHKVQMSTKHQNGWHPSYRCVFVGALPTLSPMIFSMHRKRSLMAAKLSPPEQNPQLQL